MAGTGRMDDADAFMVNHEMRCAIQLREEYLRRLHAVVFDPLQEAPDSVEVGNNIDMLRVASVEAVEAIVRWRVAQTDTSASVLQPQYLLKMATDTDFLAQNDAIAAWLQFDPVRNPFLLPPNSAPESHMLAAAFEKLRLGSTTTTLYCPIIPADMSLERMVLAAKVVAEAEVQHGAVPPSQDASFSLALDLPPPRTSGWADTPVARPRTSSTGRRTLAPLRGATMDHAAEAGMATRHRRAPPGKAGSRRQRRAAAIQRRRDKREARERRNKLRNTTMSSSKRVGRHQVPMTSHLGQSQSHRLSATIRAAKESLTALRSREHTLARAVDVASAFCAKLPTTSSADAYMTGKTDRWPGKLVALNDPYNTDLDPARYIKRDTAALFPRFSTDGGDRTRHGALPAVARPGTSSSAGVAAGSGMGVAPMGADVASGSGTPVGSRSPRPASQGEGFDTALDSALAWMSPAPKPPRKRAWATPGQTSAKQPQDALPSIAKPPDAVPHVDRAADAEERKRREEARARLDLRPGPVAWPHPLCVAPASELSVRRAQLDRVQCQIQLRQSQLQQARKQRREMLGRSKRIKDKANNDHLTRSLASISMADGGETRGPDGRRRRRRRRKGYRPPKAQPKPTVVVVPAKDANAHTAFAKQDLAFVEPAFLVYDGSRGSPPPEATSSTRRQNAMPVPSHRAPPASDDVVEMLRELVAFADRTARQVASLLTRRPFQTRFLANQGPPAPEVRALMEAVLLVLSAVPQVRPTPMPAISPATVSSTPKRASSRSELQSPAAGWDTGTPPPNTPAFVDAKARSDGEGGDGASVPDDSWAATKRIVAIDAQHVDWHSAKRCLTDDTFPRRFLRKAAVLAASSAALELDAFERRRDEDDEQDDRQWRVARGAWRLDDERRQRAEYLATSHGMANVRGAGASFHGPTAQVLLLWLKSVLTLQSAASVLRQEPGSDERMFGAQAHDADETALDAPQAQEADNEDGSAESGPEVEEVNDGDAAEADAETDQLQEGGSDAAGADGMQEADADKDGDAADTGIRRMFDVHPRDLMSRLETLPSATAWSTWSVFGQLRTAPWARRKDVTCSWQAGRHVVAAAAALPAGAPSGAAVGHAATSVSASAMAHSTAVLAGVHKDGASCVAALETKATRDGAPVRVAVLDHSLTTSRRWRLASLLCDLWPSGTGQVAVSADVVLPKPQGVTSRRVDALAVVDAVQFHMAALNVGVETAGDKRWNGAQLVHMLSTLLRQCHADGQQVIVTVGLSVKRPVAWEPNDADAPEVHAELAAAWEAAAATYVRRTIQKALARAATAWPTAPATVPACLVVSATPSSPPTRGGNDRAVTSEVLQWRGVVAVGGGTRCLATMTAERLGPVDGPNGEVAAASAREDGDVDVTVASAVHVDDIGPVSIRLEGVADGATLLSTTVRQGSVHTELASLLLAYVYCDVHGPRDVRIAAHVQLCREAVARSLATVVQRVLQHSANGTAYLVTEWDASGGERGSGPDASKWSRFSLADETGGRVTACARHVAIPTDGPAQLAFELVRDVLEPVLRPPHSGAHSSDAWHASWGTRQQASAEAQVLVAALHGRWVHRQIVRVRSHGVATTVHARVARPAGRPAAPSSALGTPLVLVTEDSKSTRVHLIGGVVARVGDTTTPSGVLSSCSTVVYGVSTHRLAVLERETRAQAELGTDAQQHAVVAVPEASPGLSATQAGALLASLVSLQRGGTAHSHTHRLQGFMHATGSGSDSEMEAEAVLDGASAAHGLQRASAAAEAKRDGGRHAVTMTMGAAHRTSRDVLVTLTVRDLRVQHAVVFHSAREGGERLDVSTTAAAASKVQLRHGDGGVGVEGIDMGTTMAQDVGSPNLGAWALYEVYRPQVAGEQVVVRLEFGEWESETLHTAGGVPLKVAPVRVVGRFRDASTGTSTYATLVVTFEGDMPAELTHVDVVGGWQGVVASYVKQHVEIATSPPSLMWVTTPLP